MLLGARHEVIRKVMASKGTLSSCLVHPRDVFRVAVRLNAGGVIVAHNHPSGNPEPSGGDVELTVRLYKAGKLIGIDVLDHLIVAKHGYLSLRERGSFDGIQMEV